MRGIAHAIAKRLELGLGNRRLDQREDLVLLELFAWLAATPAGV
jgi:hypothetical protein